MSETIKALRELLSSGPEFKYPSDLGDDDSLMQRGVADSFDMITLVLRIEERFGVKVTPDDMTEDNFYSLRSIAALIGGKAANAGGR